ncbi:putative non-specific serine/threonine protein kinase [Helianthus anomalus]
MTQLSMPSIFLTLHGSVVSSLTYKTQRSMGKQSEDYNLTWMLPIDSGFYYMLRLHFCNIIPQCNKTGQVVFRIFINNHTVQQEADLFNWTQDSAYPVFKDYIVFVHDPDASGKKRDLWLATQPSPISELYLDAYLNGLEAFKLSMNRSLAIPNPEVSNTGIAIKGNKKKTLYAMIIGGIVGALVCDTIFVFIVACLQIRFKHNGAIGGRSSELDGNILHLQM